MHCIVRQHEFKMYYVYVLKSLKDNSLYVGYSTSLKQRIESHRKGENFSTKYKLPITLIFYEAYKDRSDAKRREKYLKTTKGKTTLRTMLKGCLKANKIF